MDSRSDYVVKLFKSLINNSDEVKDLREDNRIICREIVQLKIDMTALKFHLQKKNRTQPIILAIIVGFIVIIALLNRNIVSKNSTQRIGLI